MSRYLDFSIATAMSPIETLRRWAGYIKRDALMLWFARRHPATPLGSKLLCALAVAYALSPIDLIPDFIPLLGYLDDLLVLPALIWLARRLLPQQVVRDCRRQADEWIAANNAKPVSRAGAATIVVLWIAALYLGWRWYGRA